MEDLRGLEAQVYDILVKNKDCRNSDNLLYIEILKKNNVNVLNLSVTEFFMHFADYKIPRFESVARTRRKIQEWYPDLMSFEDVRKWRKENETAFREYAKEVK